MPHTFYPVTLPLQLPFRWPNQHDGGENRGVTLRSNRPDLPTFLKRLRFWSDRTGVILVVEIAAFCCLLTSR
jgi:hypothetical protein